MLTEIICGILFVISSGLLFNEKFREHKILIGIAASIAIVSTYFLTAEITERIIDRKLREHSLPSLTEAEESKPSLQNTEPRTGENSRMADTEFPSNNADFRTEKPRLSKPPSSQISNEDESRNIDTTQRDEARISRQLSSPQQHTSGSIPSLPPASGKLVGLPPSSGPEFEIPDIGPQLGTLSSQWLAGSVYGSDNEVASLRSVSINGTPHNYSVLIENQMGFNCNLGVDSYGDPAYVEECRSKDGKWKTDRNRVMLHCSNNRTERVCRGGYIMQSGPSDFPGMITIARKL